MHCRLDNLPTRCLATSACSSHWGTIRIQ
eukprot:IDg6930t1